MKTKITINPKTAQEIYVIIDELTKKFFKGKITYEEMNECTIQLDRIVRQKGEKLYDAIKNKDKKALDELDSFYRSGIEMNHLTPRKTRAILDSEFLTLQNFSEITKLMGVILRENMDALLYFDVRGEKRLIPLDPFSILHHL